MSKHLDGTLGHPVLRFLDVLEAGLDGVADSPVWSLDGAEATEATSRLVADLARLAELQTRVLTQVETLGVPAAGGFRSLSSWLATTTHLTAREAARTTRLATALRSHELTRAALARGELHPEQAVVIARAVDALDPRQPADRELAEKHLVGEAATYDAGQLTAMGRRILETIDPARADEHEARLLEQQEARARKQTRFSMWDDGEGLAHGSFAMPSAQASMLAKALQGLSSAKHTRATQGAGSYDHEKPTPEKLGQAFAEYVERYPLAKLAHLGGMPAAVVVTVDHDVLLGARKAAHLDTGVAISPGELTRWACEARLFPAVLDTGGHVLDLGREARLHTAPQRLALGVEQKTCQHPLCDVLAAFCHVHHVIAWADGGATDTTHAVLLCPFHHHDAHARGVKYPLRT